MGDFVVGLVFMIMLCIVGGIIFTGDGHYVGGPLLVVAGLLLLALFIYAVYWPKHYCDVSDCPNKGQLPEYGRLGGGYRWFMDTTGMDDDPIAHCGDCGFISRKFGSQANPLAASIKSFEPVLRNQLPIHP